MYYFNNTKYKNFYIYCPTILIRIYILLMKKKKISQRYLKGWRVKIVHFSDYFKF